MKINSKDNTSFGITYLKTSLNYMSEANRKKLVPSYGLGQLYPVDIFLGADKQGNLTVEIMKSSLWKHLLHNNEFKMSPQNHSLSRLMAAIENQGGTIDGKRNVPVEKKVFKFMDLRSAEALPFDIANEINRYFKKYKRLFIS